MGKLIYGYNVSLDGYVEDASGSFDFGDPSEEVHAFVNDLYRSIGTHLYGRRLYETMAVWETDPMLAEASAAMADYASLWAPADKIVYSRTLDAPWTKRTRLEREFDPTEVGRLKASSSSDLTIGGAELGGAALKAGLVDEVHLFVVPVSLGGGKPVLPLGVRLRLDLADQHCFENGTLYLRYLVST